MQYFDVVEACRDRPNLDICSMSRDRRVLWQTGSPIYYKNDDFFSSSIMMCKITLGVVYEFVSFHMMCCGVEALKFYGENAD